MHGAIKEVCPQFVGAIVEFTQEVLKNEINDFIDRQDDDAQKLAKRMFGVWGVKYRKGRYEQLECEHDRIESALHIVELDDEIDTLMVEIMRAIVAQSKPR